MTDQSLHNHMLPESPVLVYPSLAATLGLEEATLIAVLTQFARQTQSTLHNGFHWFFLDTPTTEKLMPFWSAIDVQRVLTNVREQGVIILGSAPYTSSGVIKFAFNEKAARIQQKRAAPQSAGHLQRSVGTTTESVTPVKNLISPGWQPDQETLMRIAQHAIPQSFALQQVPEFVTYWRERNEAALSWGSKFLKRVVERWRAHEADQNAQTKQALMHKHWRPSEDAMEVLTKHAGIRREFVEDAIPEFVLYWREQGQSSDNWNKKFRDHVHRQWIKYQSSVENDTHPKPIPDNWTPSKDVYDVLRLANIDIPFAQALIREFVIYWRDSGQVYHSWNTRFLQYIKQRWAQRSVQANTQNTSTRELSLAQQLTDRSWAD